jgi:DNA-binding GntR family transcriptional regulator
MEAHAAFHSLFLEQSGNGRLGSMIPLVRASSAALYLPFIDNPEGVQLAVEGRLITYKQILDESQASHVAILESVVAGKAGQAETSARKHNKRTLSMLDAFDEWRKVIAEAATHEHDADQPAPPAAPKRRPRKAP